MRTAAAALLLALAAAPARAHDYPIQPVSVTLRVEPGRVVADVDSDSIYWIEEVAGLVPMPARDWPASAQAKVEAYANAHLRLSVDGRRLAGRLVDAAYVQKPWEVYEQGRFRLRLAYPAADGATLAGEGDFFEDYRQERLEGREPILANQDFRTVVSVPGRAPRAFELRPGAAAFSVPVSDARRTAFSRLLESVFVGARAALGGVEGWAALAALALSLAPSAPSRGRALGLLGAAALAAATGALPGPARLEWAAAVVAAAAAGRWLGASATPWLEAAAAAALVRAWTARALVFLPRAAPGPLERAAGAAGMAGAAALLLLLGVAAAAADRRALFRHSESRAPELFERRRRLAATALLLVGAGGIVARLAR